VEEMDEAMIEKWNSVIKKGDRVFHLGDFGFADRFELAKIEKRLTGYITLIKGNHDKQEVESLFQGRIFDVYWLKHSEKQIFMSHYAHRVWMNSHYGSYHLYGHSHGLLPARDGYREMDVGVDANEFTPVSFDEVVARMEAVNWICPIEERKDGKTSA
jgi:calcineurin-like phosphoesterase family protein